MFSFIRNRFGIPGVISVLALVFAMFGGAYAASSSGGGKASTSAASKKGPRGPRGKTGPAGPSGPVGPQGPAGAIGPAGASGKDGAPGSAGLPGADGTDGVDGSPWTAGGTLPVGATETGMWSFASSKAEGSIAVPISFTIPLAAKLSPANVKFVSNTANPDPTNCPGTVEKPEAASGFVCIYEAPGAVNATHLFDNSPSVAGVLSLFVIPEDKAAAAFGSYAVTG